MNRKKSPSTINAAMHHCDDACAVAINAAMQSLAKMPQIKKDSFKKKSLHGGKAGLTSGRGAFSINQSRNSFHSCSALCVGSILGCRLAFKALIFKDNVIRAL